MPDISKITMPSGTVYDIKDAYARTVIAGGMSFIGVTTTALTDGSTTNPITIDGASVTAQNGNVTVYGNAEFVWVEPTGENGRWVKFGDESNLGDLAYKDSASGTFTPSGSVSGSFTGTPVRLVTDEIRTTIGVELVTSNKTVSVSGTPSGTVSTPTISVDSAGSTTTIKNPTSTTKVASVVTANAGATAPSNPLSYAEVSGETLILNQIGYTTGATITTSNVTVKTGDATYTASTPTFTGTALTATGTLTNYPTSVSRTEGINRYSVSVAESGTATYTPSGSISVSFTGTAGTITVS